jgi:predicted amidophosphoribosyltransferase
VDDGWPPHIPGARRTWAWRPVDAAVVGTLASALAAGLDLLAPARCAGCRGRADSGGIVRALCPTCRQSLRQSAPVAQELSRPGDAGPLPVFSAAAYDGVVRSVLLDYKEHGQLALRGELGRCLALSLLAAITSVQADDVLLVAAPSASAARRARGHDPVGGLARVARRQLRAIGFGIDVRPVLRQARKVADQSGLDQSARQANLLGALTVTRPATVRGRRVVVVDDIVTTGATAVEAARALAACGAQALAVASVAATPRRRPARSPVLHDAVEAD